MLSVRVTAWGLFEVLCGGECVNRSCSRQAAEGRSEVAQPQRWLSGAKCVDRLVGKSAGHMVEA